MRVTWRNRMIYACLWGLSVLGITFYGGGISYGLFAAMTLVPVVSFGYVLYVLYCFRIYQEMGSRWIQVNQRVPFYFSLVNEFCFGFVGVRVNYYSSFSSIIGLDDAIEYELLPNTRIHKESEIICRYRGRYLVGIKEIEVSDYFRLIRLVYRNKEPLQAVVRPQLVRLDRLNCMDELNFISRERDMADTCPDVLVRRYESGDDPRQINWKVSARANELMVRKRIGERGQGVYILFTTDRKEEDEYQYLPPENKVLETVLAFALFYAEKKIDSVTYYMQNTLECVRLSGIESFDRYYETISGAEFHRSYEPQRLLAMLGNMRELFEAQLVIYVVYELTEIGVQLARRLAQNGVFVLICLISEAAEASVPEGLPHVKVIRIASDQPLQEVL